MPRRKRYVSYLRVSTDRQGQSGLGLEAQRAAVAGYINGGELLREFLEVESGKHDDRPQLAKALHHAKVTGATLLIAKLDRLSRDAHFLLGLQKAGVRFIAADMPEANETMIGFMAVMAQHEREAISRRTKEALAAAKARGVKLGNPQGAAHLRGRYQHLAVEAVKENAARFAEDLKPVVDDIREAGHTSIRAIAAELNKRGIRTARDRQWHPTSAARLLQRIDAA
jgi:DNA invertase Pin-like site-specific DNA recombinase